MPGCVLRASGEGFQPREFLASSSLAPCNVFLKGERRAEERVWSSSGFAVVVSDARGEDFPQQVRDAVEFLRTNKEELTCLVGCHGLEDARLDFGVSRSEAFIRCDYLPPELLTLAGSLGLGVEISTYVAVE